jgi:hypothetical protein
MSADEFIEGSAMAVEYPLASQVGEDGLGELTGDGHGVARVENNALGKLPLTNGGLDVFEVEGVHASPPQR